MPLIDGIVDRSADILRRSLQIVDEMVTEDTDAVLLRRFQRNYASLTLEEVVAIRGTLGHTDGEKDPCRVCRIMAVKEAERSDLED